MKKIILFVGLCLSCFLLAPNPRALSVRANTISTQSSLFESTSLASTSSSTISTSVEEETSAIEKLENQITDIWNTKVMPIIAGISLTTIVNFIYSYIMNRKNKKTTDSCAKTVDNITALTNKVAEISNGVLNDLKDSKEHIVKLENEFKNTINSIAVLLNQLIMETKNIKDIRPILTAMSEILTKTALNSREIVKSGAGEEIAELQAYIKSLGV